MPRNGNAIDGFVRRNRGSQGAHRRPTLDRQKGALSARRTDGFVPRHADASAPVQFSDKDAWIDDNTLAIDPDAPILDQGRDIKGGIKKPKFWQFIKKRRLNKGKPEPSRRKKVLKRIGLFIAFILIIIGGYLGWKILKNTAQIFDGNVLGFLDSAKLKGESEGRVNILLAGNSADDKGHEGASLTDSIMIASLNTKDNTAFMISIPRDLYVDYGVRNCSVGYKGKINAAYLCGEQINFNEDGYAEGGMGLLAKVVEAHFGIKTHYYALVNYSAFKDGVDAVGGITIDIKSNDPRGIYDPSLDYTTRNCCALAKYPNGSVKLNGKQALNLARARGDAYGSYGFSQSDFNRTENQRKMLLALKDKALSAGTLSNPAKIASLFDSVGKNVDTDIKTNEVRRMYELGKKVESKNIKSIGLNDKDVALVTTTTISGAGSVVVPVAGTTNYTQIKRYMQGLTSSDPLVREAAGVVVLNGSGVSGLAQTKSDELAVKGINITDIGNAAARDITTILDLSGGTKPSTKAALQQKFGVSATTNKTSVPEAANYQADFIVIIGKQGSSVSGSN